MAPLQGLVRIAQQPQRTADIGPGNDPGPLTIEPGLGTVLLGIVEGNRLLQGPEGRHQLAVMQGGRPWHEVGLQEKCRGLDALGQGEALFLELSRHVEFRPQGVEVPQPPEHGKELWRLPYHDETSMDAQAHGQLHPALRLQAGIEWSQGLHDAQPGPHHLTQLFSVELAGEHGGVHQVTKQHSELAPLRIG